MTRVEKGQRIIFLSAVGSNPSGYFQILEKMGKVGSEDFNSHSTGFYPRAVYQLIEEAIARGALEEVDNQKIALTELGKAELRDLKGHAAY